MTPPRLLFRRLRFVWVFLLGLVGLDVALRLNHKTWERHSPDGYTERVEGCAAERRDVVFVGGSPVAEGINPALIGGVNWRGERLTNHYAVGLSGGTTSDVYFATLHACPKPPRVLVYGITASDLNDSRHEPHGANSLLTLADLADWQRTRPEAAEWVTRHFWQARLSEVWAAYRYRHGVKLWAASLCPQCCPVTAEEADRQRTIGEQVASQRGYAPTRWFDRSYEQMKAGGWEQPPFEYLARYRTGSHLKYLHRLIDWAEANNVTVVLIDMPTTADLERRHPAEFAEFRQRLAEVVAVRGVPVLRATRETVGLTDQHFADLIHPNPAGAAVLSGWLKAELERIGNETSRVVRGAAP
ncbi:MAG: hypothetical protein MUF18_19460 [Fimbriiglobus sp.]|jgi:hypothetical protein|nr:hypothetical protein [Fimbriiglobus sp.]